MNVTTGTRVQLIFLIFNVLRSAHHHRRLAVSGFAIISRGTGQSCSTGNSCVTSETCSGTTCGGGTPVTDETQCDDGDACTINDSCESGICESDPSVRQRQCL